MKPTIEQVKEFARQYSGKATLANPDEKALHIYTDTAGNPLYWRARLKNNATGEKWIRPFFHDGEQFQCGEPPAPDTGKPLYGLHLLPIRPDSLVWIVEGEKAAVALNKAFKAWAVDSQHVTTTSGGMSSARSADWQPLAGKRVVVWPDNDEPGAKYAAEVCECLQGIAASVMTLDISGLNLPAKGDAFDWLQRDGANLDALLLLLDASRTYAPIPAQDAPQSPDELYPTLIQANETEELQREIDALAAMPLLKYERTYKEQAKRLKIRAAVLDKLVQAVRSGASEEGVAMFPEVVPWPSIVDAGAVLSELSEGFRRYAVLPTHADDALALWCAFTWFCEASHIAPLLVIRSPEKGCGKSTVLSIVKRLVYRPWVLSGISAAVLYRVADKHRPTVLIDEGDTFLNNENQDLHGIINSGHSKDAPYFWRCVGDDHEPKGFYVFSPKAIAFIGHTRDTLHDRAVEVELRRKMPSEKVARLRHADGGELDTLARKLARLTEDNLAAFAAMRPAMPESLPDRQADNWEPLLAIAMLAGDEWVQRATAAALALTGSKAQSAPVSMGVELLTDIQHIFESKRTDKIRTAELVQALCDDPEAAWATYNRGKQISPRQVAKRLAEYGIKADPIREGYEVFRGYRKEQFEDAFTRYRATPPKNPEKNVTTLQPSNGVGCDVTHTGSVTVTQTPFVTRKPNTGAGCNTVTDYSGETGTNTEAESEVEL
jgi:hypothetical protein